MDPLVAGLKWLVVPLPTSNYWETSSHDDKRACKMSNPSYIHLNAFEFMEIITED